jgi:hypothetical protein
MKKYITLLLFIAAIMMASCESFLDLDQPDIVEKEQNFKDAQTVRSSVMGIYSVIAETVEQTFLAGEVRADLATATDGASYYIKEFSNNNVSSSNPYASPRKFYEAVVNGNEIMAQLGKTLYEGAIDTAEYNSMKGELLALRAWSNLQMLKLYGKSKYIKGTMDDYPNDNASYSTKEEVLDMAIKDLQAADILKVGLGIPEWERVRISRFYINVLLGEAFMEKAMYKEAADKFHEVIRKGDDEFQLPGDTVGYSSKFKLNVFGGENWGEIFWSNWSSNGVAEEFLFYIGFDDNSNQQNELQDWTSSGAGSYQVKPTPWIVNELLYNGIFNYRAKSIGYGVDDYAIQKYNFRSDGSGDAGLIVNRAGRLNLLLAECVNRQGYSDSALAIINDGVALGGTYLTAGVRGRVQEPAIAPDGALAGDELMLAIEDIILDELARELAFEGHRWFDLVRIAERRNDPAILADRVAYKFPLAIRESKKEEYMDPLGWYLPLTD